MQDPNTFPLYSLFAEHEERLTASGIDPRCIKSRGYYTDTLRAALGKLGFGRDQRLTPCLVIPTWGLNGKRQLYQIRPNSPRVKNGREVKYEFPAGSKLVLDIPPDVRDKVLDPAAPLLITEGILKGDAAVSRGLACVTSLGVEGWANDVETWDAIPLRGRRVLVAFDSDVQVNRHVHRAASRLAEFLKKRGPNVEFLLLPGEEDGSKVGLDDFLNAGNSVDVLLALAAAELPGLPSSAADDSADHARYEVTDDGIFKLKPWKDGELLRVRLTNFSARIIAELDFVDDRLKAREFEIEVKLKGKTLLIVVMADEYERMNWPVTEIGGGAVIYAGQGNKDEARAAIQLLLGDIKIVPTFNQRELPENKRVTTRDPGFEPSEVYPTG